MKDRDTSFGDVGRGKVARQARANDSSLSLSEPDPQRFLSNGMGHEGSCTIFVSNKRACFISHKFMRIRRFLVRVRVCACVYVCVW